MLQGNKTTENLQAEIDKLMKTAQKKINKILKETYIEIAGYEAEIELLSHRREFGFCHYYWTVKKRILKEKYNIDWKTPAEKNPLRIYD